MFVRISPPDACNNGGSRVDSTGCLGRWFLIPLNDIYRSDALVHGEATRGRQYVVLVFAFLSFFGIGRDWGIGGL